MDPQKKEWHIGEKWLHPKVEIRQREFWRDLAGEVISTFFLLAVQCSVALPWGQENAGRGSPFLVGIGMFSIVFILIEIFGPFGGAQMNPAVTVSMLFRRKISPFKALMYVICQAIGGIGGSAFIYVVTPAGRRATLAATVVNPELAVWQGVLVEVWLTGILLFIVQGSANAKRKRVYMGSIVVGMSISLLPSIGGYYTGASMNPVRSLGPALMMGIWENHWVYWVGTIGGGLISTAIFQSLNRVDTVRKPGVGLMTGPVNPGQLTAPAKPQAWESHDPDNSLDATQL